MVETDPTKYFYIAQGKTTIDGVDDMEEMRLTDEAYDILGISQVWRETELSNEIK